MNRCVIIGASPDSDINTIKDRISKDDYIVCADGGYVYAQKAGISPDLIVGDFDSCALPQETDTELIALPCEKDDTDTMYCVKLCLLRGYRSFLLLGMTGGREDHSYANLCTLLYLHNRGAEAAIIDSNTEISVISGEISINNKKGSIFSIFPFGCNECCVTLVGFKYELRHGILSSEFPLGVSNEIISDSTKVTVHSGTALIMIEDHSKNL